MQTKNIHSLNSRRARIGVGCFVILVASPFVLYFGYCWGLWGRYSILLQYHFQCSCPAISQEARYPRRVDVILPACSHSGANVSLSPSGRLLYVQEELSGGFTSYLLDLQTRQKIDIGDQPMSSFLTDDLWFLERDGYIIDRITGVWYPIEKFVSSRPNGQINGEANLPLLVESLRQAEQVFLFGPSTDTVVALVADFRAHPEQNFIVDRFDIRGSGTDRMKLFLQENHINYKLVLPAFPAEVVSPDGRLVARPDGIYVVATGEKVLEGFSPSRFLFRPHSQRFFVPRGWLYDGSGVIYSMFITPCLIDKYFLNGDRNGCSYPVRQPVLLFKIPEEYVSP